MWHAAVARCASNMHGLRLVASCMQGGAGFKRVVDEGVSLIQGLELPFIPFLCWAPFADACRGIRS